MTQSTRLRAPTTYAPPVRRRTTAAPPSGEPVGALRRDTIANLVGRGSVAVCSLLFVPLYIKLLGVEAYGLVGFATTLQIGMSLLDVGLATTLNRELARSVGIADASTDSARASRTQRDLVRTLEVTYWAAALLLGAIVALAAPVIAERWLQAERLPIAAVTNAIRLIGLSIVLQFPFTLYEGGLLGLGRQVTLNTLLVIGAALRFGAVVVVLMVVAATIEAFFIWQVLVSAVQTAAAGWLLWRSLPRGGGRPRFRVHHLIGVWRFAAGMGGITLTALVLTHMDKLVVSKLLTLSEFGYYTLASVAAGVLYMLFLPVFQAVFPRLSRLVASGDDAATAALYHRSAQGLSVVLLPAAIVLALFSREVMLLWTQSTEAADATHVVVSLFAIGTALHGLMNIPYALQLAAGWTRLALYANLIGIAVLFPSLIVLSSRYGAVGAGMVWVVLNAGYATIGLAVMHRRLLRAELRRWYLVDVGWPLLLTLAAASVVRLAIPMPSRIVPLIGVVALALVASYGVALVGTSVGRSVLRRVS